LDWHEVPEGVTAEEVALWHVRDLEVQDRYGVRYLTYWFDPDRQANFCLVDAPSKILAETVHREAHGLMAYRIIEVDPRQIDAFLGAIPQARPAEPYVETAFRAILPPLCLRRPQEGDAARVQSARSRLRGGVAAGP
jgi:hypothetical protein